MESITLYFREGPSDKVYQASIDPKDDGYHVHSAYGRRGSTLNTGSKTQTPVAYPIAKDIYDKLIREKMAKGYKPGADGVVTRLRILPTSTPAFTASFSIPCTSSSSTRCCSTQITGCRRRSMAAGC